MVELDFINNTSNTVEYRISNQGHDIANFFLPPNGGMSLNVTAGISILIRVATDIIGCPFVDKTVVLETGFRYLIELAPKTGCVTAITIDKLRQLPPGVISVAAIGISLTSASVRISGGKC